MCDEPVLFNYRLQEALWVAHSNCGRRIKFSFVALNCEQKLFLFQHFTPVVIFQTVQCRYCEQYAVTISKNSTNL